jgi:flagellar hook-basal body complex protein FliE
MRHTSGDRSSTRSHKTNSDSEPVTTSRNSENPTVDNQPSPRHDKKEKAKTKPTDPKQAHSLVEKRYRENLNAKITELHTVLVSVPDGSPSPETNQTRKSEVLQTAIDYVNQTQLEMRHMTNDINRLNTRVRALEKLVKCEDCTLLKGFDGLKVLGGGGAGGGSGMGMNFNGVGAEYGLAAPSAG